MKPSTFPSAIPHVGDAVLRSAFALGASIFLPFVAGYFLSYYFRAVNAVLSPRLMVDLGLDATQLGIVSSAYFLTAALAQIPLGMAMDRWGPRAVQAPCMLVAAAGAALTSVSDGFVPLFLGRALIGLGVASALMSGLKAIVLWMPRERVPLVTGVFIAMGSIGVLGASLPTEWALQSFSWRQLFAFLAAACVVSSVAIAVLSPRHGVVVHAPAEPSLGLLAIYRDRRFWRLAPLSASTIGMAWAFQGLWAAPWLRDVAGAGQQTIALHLLAMAVALSTAALGFGMLIDRLKRNGVDTSAILAVTAALFIVAELTLALDLPVPFLAPLSAIGAFGAGTVLSYSLTAEWFSKASIGRANGALNVLHFGFAFAFQGTFGWLVARWAPDAAFHYPAVAYKHALLLTVSLQLLSLLWFVVPDRVEPRAAGGAQPAHTMWRRAIAIGAAAMLALVAANVVPSRPEISTAALQHGFESGSRAIGETVTALIQAR